MAVTALVGHLAFSLTLLAASCGGDGEDLPSAANRSTDPSPSAAAASPIEGRFEVEEGRQLAIQCWGEGAPTVVLETGHPNPGGIQDFEDSEFVDELVTHSRVCAYDRAGTGSSDPAPTEPRSADDVVQDLDALLSAAEVDAPYVLVGASFGGMIVTYYASQFPEDVAGVALLDVPAPSDELSVKELPEIAWDHPANPEHVDVVKEFEGRFAREPASFKAPLVVITARQGQSSAEDQKYWMELSPDARPATLDGGHDIWLDDPKATAAEVLRLI